MIEYSKEPGRWTQFEIQIKFADLGYTSDIVILMNSQLRGKALLDQILSLPIHRRSIIENNAELVYDAYSKTYKLRLHDNDNRSYFIHNISYSELLNMIIGTEIIKAIPFRL